MTARLKGCHACCFENTSKSKRSNLPPRRGDAEKGRNNLVDKTLCVPAGESVTYFHLFHVPRQGRGKRLLGKFSKIGFWGGLNEKAGLYG